MTTEPETVTESNQELSRVDGKLVDKDRLNSDERIIAAHKLRLAGHAWESVAQMVGYANGQTALVTVRSYLQRVGRGISQEERQEALELETDRLDGLLGTYWPDAIAGNIKAAELVLKVIQTRSRLLGLEELHTKTGQTSKTILVAGNSEQYIQALKAIAGEED